MKDKRLRIISMLMLVLTINLFLGTTLFVHTHTTDEGVVTHSHPFVPGGSHQHSHAAFSIIHQIDNVLASAVTVDRLTIVAYSTSVFAVTRILDVDCLSQTSECLSLRAPPVMA